MTETLAQTTRRTTLRELEGSFDVLVVGGGATGLGIAVDAATRGLRTALVEAGDFAQSTSSRSTKLIHGGVRYLASGQVHLVYEALHERAVLKRNAPHLIRPLPTILPTFRVVDLPFYGAGLLAYDLLSGSASMGRTRLLGVKATAERIPGIGTAGLRGSVLYFDAQFNDARLALTLARTAVDHGAVVANYVRCARLLHEGGRVVGAVIEDSETGDAITVRAGAVINAAGIFSDEISAMDDRSRPKLLSLSRGSHIVVRREVLGGDAALMVPKTTDGRVIFAIPWQGRVVIGTTDLPATTTAMEPGYTTDEIGYLLAHINPYLATPIGREDVLSVFSGLRPLVTGPANTTSKLSREHHIDVAASGLVTIAGGKWTTYRRMAEDALTAATRRGLVPERACVTATTRLHGTNGVGGETDRAGEAGPRAAAEYGSDARLLAELMAKDGALGRPLDAALPYSRAMVVYAARYEMARTLEDVLSRRTRSLLLDAAATLRAAPVAAALLAAELGEDAGWAARQEAQLRELVRRDYSLDATG